MGFRNFADNDFRYVWRFADMVFLCVFCFFLPRATGASSASTRSILARYRTHSKVQSVVQKIGHVVILIPWAEAFFPDPKQRTRDPKNILSQKLYVIFFLDFFIWFLKMEPRATGASSASTRSILEIPDSFESSVRCAKDWPRRHPDPMRRKKQRTRGPKYRNFGNLTIFRTPKSVDFLKLFR